MNDPSRTFEVEGQWWLPGRDDRKIAGILRFDSDSGAELRLIGTFRSIFEEGERTQQPGGTVTVAVSMESIERDGTYPRIHGLAEGKPYTLEDCFRGRTTRHLIGGTGTETVHVNQILRGAYFEKDEELAANGMSVDLRYLTHWACSSALKETWAFRTDEREDLPLDAPDITLEARTRDDAVVVLPEGDTLRLAHSVTVEGDRVTTRGLTQNFSFRFDASSLCPLPELVERASDLQDLVSIATGRTAEFDGMRFWHPDLIWEREGRQHRQSIEFFVSWNAKDKSKNPGELPLHDMFFSYAEFGGIDGIGRWLESAARHRGALGRVMASRYAKSMFVSDRLLNRAAALEAFDRTTFGHSQSKFKTRLGRCADLAGELFVELVGDVETWAEVVRNDRDDIAHHLGTRVKQTPSAQLFLADSLYWLFVLCMLRDVKSPQAVFDRIEHHPELTWLGPKIRAAL
ncbi:HEPN domain-containing protein [Herbidospora daliensis]|uniref:ApeA N-terminal domain 1-containing protein n=1 Tax=Herbidospora daliensis TaxID=295585 RepID=UPI000AA5D7F2|nr:HEPN domain-containing protein [Herbidospora daliensis]